MNARANTFGSPLGGAEHHNHQTYVSTNVRNTLDTTPCEHNNRQNPATHLVAGFPRILNRV